MSGIVTQNIHGYDFEPTYSKDIGAGGTQWRVQYADISRYTGKGTHPWKSYGYFGYYSTSGGGFSGTSCYLRCSDWWTDYAATSCCTGWQMTGDLHVSKGIKTMYTNPTYTWSSTQYGSKEEEKKLTSTTYYIEDVTHYNTGTGSRYCQLGVNVGRDFITTGNMTAAYGTNLGWEIIE